jgi:hypothetical protein
MPDRFSILVVDPEGNEMWLRHGYRPGGGPLVTFASRKAAKEQVEFMKIGLEEGEDYESISIVPTPVNPPECDLPIATLDFPEPDAEKVVHEVRPDGSRFCDFTNAFDGKEKSNVV